MDLTGLTPENLQKFVFDFYGQVSPIDPLATAVLNTHFLVEEEIDAVLAKIPNLKLKRNVVFAQKVKGIRKIAPLGNDKLWQTILAINQQRRDQGDLDKQYLDSHPGQTQGDLDKGRAEHWKKRDAIGGAPPTSSLDSDRSKGVVVNHFHGISDRDMAQKLGTASRPALRNAFL